MGKGKDGARRIAGEEGCPRVMIEPSGVDSGPLRVSVRPTALVVYISANLGSEDAAGVVSAMPEVSCARIRLVDSTPDFERLRRPR